MYITLAIAERVRGRPLAAHVPKTGAYFTFKGACLQRKGGGKTGPAPGNDADIPAVLPSLRPISVRLLFERLNRYCMLPIMTFEHLSFRLDRIAHTDVFIYLSVGVDMQGRFLAIVLLYGIRIAVNTQ